MQHPIKNKVTLFLLLSFPFSLSANIVINEFMAANEDALFDESGESPDWIELYNNSNESINLENWTISDDENDLSKWQFPKIIMESRSYLIIFASGKDESSTTEFHTNFKLGASGETIILSNTQGEIIDFIEFDEQEENYSFGRLADGFEDWGIFSKSSPFASNVSGILAGSTATQLSFSHEAGLYFEPINLEITSDDLSVKIFYTTNGNEPTPEDNLFTETLNLNQENIEPAEFAYIPTSTVWQSPVGETRKFHTIRARAFIENAPVSEVYSATYFVQEKTEKFYSLPIISMITEGDNLFSFEDGIYVNGANQNFKQRGIDWERPIHFEYFEKDGKLSFKQNLGLRITGNSSRNMPQKSLKIYARSEYGDNRIRYPLFGENYDSTFKKLKLRNLNGDRNAIGFSDDLAHEIVYGQADLDYSEKQFVIVLINGEFWGIHSLRESLDDHHLGQKFGFDNENIALAHAHKNGIDTVAGSLDTYFDLLDFVRNNDLKEPENYNYLTTKIDITNFQETLISQIVLANTDWPHHNNRFWQAMNPETKWRWIFFDLDASFNATVFDNLGKIFEPELDASQFPESEDYELINALMRNKTFAISFRNKMFRMIDGTFSPKRTIPIFEEMVATISPEMEAHIRRWNFPKSYKKWESNLQNVRDFLIIRPNYISGELRARMGAPIDVFPNPAVDFLTVEMELAKAQTIKLELIDAAGRIIPLGTKDLGEGKQSFNLKISEGVQTGIYFLMVYTEGRILRERVVILK